MGDKIVFSGDKNKVENAIIDKKKYYDRRKLTYQVIHQVFNHPKASLSISISVIFIIIVIIVGGTILKNPQQQLIGKWKLHKSAVYAIIDGYGATIDEIDKEEIKQIEAAVELVYFEFLSDSTLLIDENGSQIYLEYTVLGDGELKITGSLRILFASTQKSTILNYKVKGNKLYLWKRGDELNKNLYFTKQK